MPDIVSRSQKGESLNHSIDSQSNRQGSAIRSRAVYLIGGGYNHRRNQSHSAVALHNLKDSKIGEIRESTNELTKIAEYENKMKNRVNYLEKEEKRML